MSSTKSKLNIESKKNSSILLVSKSPRRQDLLSQAGYQFEPFSLEISEITDENLNCFDQCKSLACLKMEHFKDEILNNPKKERKIDLKKFKYILTSDTMVEFQGESLGKPKDLIQAKNWLLKYSGKEQWVHTGCCLIEIDQKQKIVKEKSWAVSTKIIFKKITEQNIDLYLKNNTAVLEKAGGYGIQDANFNLVSGIEGSYSNVVGLPLESLSEEFKNWDQ